jgi:hypothetical protein
MSATPASLLRSFALCASLFGAATLASAQAPATQALALPSDNYKEWASISHHLEANPLDPQLNHDAEIAVHQISSSPDFHTPLCSSFFSFFNKLTADGYPYQAQIYRLYTLGSATYRIETGKTDAYGTNLYAFDSILKAYSVMVHQEPNARQRVLEDLYITTLKGKLPEYLKKDSTCK